MAADMFHINVMRRGVEHGKEEEEEGQADKHRLC